MSPAPKLIVLAVLAAASTLATAQRADRAGSADRWNIAGPAWYDTKCGHIGFSPTHGLPDQKWRQPCSVPIRVCEFKSLTINYPADPDVPCERMASASTAGELQRTYLKRWD